jgi:hypothetical protein
MAEGTQHVSGDEMNVKPEYIDNIFSDVQLRKLMVNALTTAHEEARQSQCSYMSGYMGKEIYFGANHFGQFELSEYGFRLSGKNGQLKLVSVQYFGVPVCLTFHSGNVFSDVLAKFNAQKGIEVRKALIENRAFVSQLEPSLFSLHEDAFGDSIDRLNIVVMHSSTQSSMEAWMILPVRFLHGSSQLLECKRVEALIRLNKDEPTIPEMISGPDYDSTEISLDRRTAS